MNQEPPGLGDRGKAQETGPPWAELRGTEKRKTTLDRKCELEVGEAALGNTVGLRRERHHHISSRGHGESHGGIFQS